jgi:BON domain
MPINIDLRRTVLDELDWEPSINADDIAVTVHDGVVTLTGFTASYAENPGRSTLDRCSDSFARK